MKDDEEIIIQLKIRKANLSSMLQGVCLGLDAATGNPIGVRLEPEEGQKEVYRLAVVCPKSAAVTAVPQPVFADPRRSLN